MKKILFLFFALVFANFTFAQKQKVNGLKHNTPEKSRRTSAKSSKFTYNEEIKTITKFVVDESFYSLNPNSDLCAKLKEVAMKNLIVFTTNEKSKVIDNVKVSKKANRNSPRQVNGLLSLGKYKLKVKLEFLKDKKREKFRGRISIDKSELTRIGVSSKSVLIDLIGDMSREQ